MKFALIKFVEGRNKESVNLVSTDVILNFDTHLSPKELQGKTYQIQWQARSENGSFDGCYPGEILLVGATADEIRFKAKEANIRLPRSFPPPNLGNNQSKEALKKPLTKRRHRKNEKEDPELLAKKNRMEATLNALVHDKGSKGGPSVKECGRSSDEDNLFEAPLSTLKVSLQQQEKKSIVLDAKIVPGGSSTKERSPEQFTEDTEDHFKSSISTVDSNCDKEKDQVKNFEASSKNLADVFYSVTDTDITNSSDEDDVTVQLENLKKKHMKCEDILREHKSCGTEMRVAELAIRKFREKVAELLKEKEETQKELTLLKEINYKLQLKLHSENSKGRSKRTSSEKGSESNSSMMASPMSASPSSAVKKRSHSKVPVDHRGGDKHTSSEKGSESYSSMMASPMSASPSSAVKKRSHSKVPVHHRGGDKHTSSEKAGSESFTLTETLISPCASPLKTNKKHSSHSKVAGHYEAAENLYYRGETGKGSSKLGAVHADTFDSLRGFPDYEMNEFCDSHPDSFDASSSSELLGNGVARKLFSSAEKESNKGLSSSKDFDPPESDEESIVERIRTKGQKKLNTNDSNTKVYVGSGHFINKNAWEDKICKQQEDSKFFKECAVGIWGSNALAQRTSSRPTAMKKTATPCKLRLLNAMLKGKLRARNADAATVGLIIPKQSTKWLGDKMYDCSRTSRASNEMKKTPPP